MNVLTPDDLAKLLQLPRRTVMENICTQKGFPESITGIRKPRWLEDSVLEFFKARGGAFPQNSQL